MGSTILKRMLALVVMVCWGTVMAETPAVVAEAEAELTCHRIIDDNNPDGQVYCGTQEQWAELHRRIAIMKEGVVCRLANIMQKTCMTATQWETFERRQRDIGQAASMGMAQNAGVPAVHQGSSSSFFSDMAFNIQQQSFQQH